VFVEQQEDGAGLPAPPVPSAVVGRSVASLASVGRSGENPQLDTRGPSKESRKGRVSTLTQVCTRYDITNMPTTWCLPSGCVQMGAETRAVQKTHTSTTRYIAVL
jgi:hypothetical protein